MRMKKITTANPGGTDSHTVVFPSKSATMVTAKQNPRIAREYRHLTQKNKLASTLRGGSLDSTGFPDNKPTIIATTYDACRIPENSIANATHMVKIAK